MSGMLHPVGPEDPQVYWLRRAAIVVALVLVVLLVVALTRPPGPDRMAVPSSSPTPLVLGTPTPTPTPTLTPEPTPSATPTDPVSSATPAATPGAAVTPRPAPTPTTPSACDPADLALVLGGGDGAEVGADTTFTVQVTNDSDLACSVGWESPAAELRIFSGTDRIWSTDDCERWFTAVPAQVVEPGTSLAAEVSWQGQRSYPGCKLASSALQPGTYVATAEIEGAAPTQKVFPLN